MGLTGEVLRERYLSARRKTQDQIEKLVASFGSQKNEPSIKANWLKITKYVSGISSLKHHFGFRANVSEGLAAIEKIQSDAWPGDEDDRMAKFGKNVVAPLARLNMGKELEATARDFLDELKVLPKPNPISEQEEIEDVVESFEEDETPAGGGQIPSDEVNPH